MTGIDLLKSIACAVMFVCAVVLSYYVRRDATQEDPPPTCIEVRGPATDKAEHLWSAACVSSWSAEYCIEQACIAFRGLP